jgi:hypothetical protein
MDSADTDPQPRGGGKAWKNQPHSLPNNPARAVVALHLCANKDG